MPKKTQKSNKNRQGGKRNLPPVPAPSTISYRGRIPVNNSESGAVATLRRAFQVTTNGSGLYAATQTYDPSGCDNWSEYATIWEEYRVLGIRYEYYPTFTVNTTGVGGGLMVNSIMHTLVSPSPGNITEAYSYGDSRVGNVFKPFVREWKMSEVGEAEFVKTSTPATDQYTLMTYIDQGGSSIAYGVVFCNYLIQFRTLRK